MLDFVPIWGLFIFVLLVVIIAIEGGYRLMRSKFKRSEPEHEGLVSIIAGSSLGLLGFVLAFAFSIVYARFETRKELVRQEANAIRRAWLRADFMEEPDHSSTLRLLKEYLDVRLQVASAKGTDEIDRAVLQSNALQLELWGLGVVNTRRNALSGMSAPYLQSLTDLIDINSQRVAIGAQDRIPSVIWIALGIMLLLSMTTIGYLSAMKGGKRSVMTLLLALSFSMLFSVVAALDDPLHGIFKASQQPLKNVKAQMAIQERPAAR